MAKVTLVVTACATLLSAGTALATPTAQQKCDSARTLAWSKYLSCMNGLVAQEAKGKPFNHIAKFTKCRHKYFVRWTKYRRQGR
jgi:hypothetical protein